MIEDILALLKKRNIKIWYTSDTHFGHTNITHGVSNWSDKDNKCRPFDTVNEMSKHMLDQINKYVGKNDLLFHLGDWSFGNNYNVINYRNQLICNNIVLLYGNHDLYIRKHRDMYKESFVEMLELFSFRHNGDYVKLMHYPLAEWDNYTGHDTYVLHGHSHGNLPYIKNRFDVGLDNAYKLFGEYIPFEHNELMKLIKTLNEEN